MLFAPGKINSLNELCEVLYQKRANLYVLKQSLFYTPENCSMAFVNLHGTIHCKYIDLGFASNK